MCKKPRYNHWKNLVPESYKKTLHLEEVEEQRGCVERKAQVMEFCMLRTIMEGCPEVNKDL